MPDNSEPISKLDLLFDDGDIDNATLLQRFKWNVLEDGQWDFSNGVHTAKGHFITVTYSGAHKGSPADHSLRLGDVLGIRKGRCWRVKASRMPGKFDSYGIALGWYDDSDAALVLVSGRINNIGSNWEAGDRLYLPFYGFGGPDQTNGNRSDTFPIGIAVGPKDMLFVPRLDV